jgi:hypothetical protein
MAGPLDLRGSATVTNNASKTLREMAKDIQGVASAGAGANRSLTSMSRDSGRAFGSFANQVRASSTDMTAQMSRWHADALRAQQNSFSGRMGAWQRDMAGQLAAANMSGWQRAGQQAGEAFRRGFGGFRAWDREHGIATGTIVGGAARKVSADVIEQANEVYRLKQNMFMGGATKDEVSEAEKKAWVLTGKFRNMSVAENLELMNNARAIYGSQHEGIEHVEPFISAGSFLKAYQGGRHAGATHDLLRELEAAMKSGEIAGKITPAEMERHISGLLAMKMTYGNNVPIARYLQAQRNAAASFLPLSDKYRYGVFPALVQEYGPGAGVMMQTAAQKLVADVGHKKYAIAAQQEFGIRDAEGKIVNSNLYAKNKLEWVLEELAPRMAKRTEGMSKDDAMVEAFRQVGRMFPDRNAAKELIELMIQAPKLLKDQALIEHARSDPEAIRQYLNESLDYQMDAFSTGVKNLAAAVGEPMIAPIREGTKALGDALSWFTNLTKENKPGAAGAGVLGLAGAGALLYGLTRMPGGRFALGGLLGAGLNQGVVGSLLGALVLDRVLGGAAGAASPITGSAVAGAAAGGGILSRIWSGAGGFFSTVLPVLSLGGMALDAGSDFRADLRKKKAERDGTDTASTKLWTDYLTLPSLSSPAAASEVPGTIVDMGPQAEAAQAQVSAAAGGMAADMAGLGDQFRAALSGIDLTADGQRIMESLAAGLRAGISSAVAAVDEAGHQIEAAASRIKLNTGPMMRGAD